MRKKWLLLTVLVLCLGLLASCNKDGKEGENENTDVIAGKTIVWLGSSMTYGYSSNGYSMADAIAEKHENVTCHKYAVSGTTLSNVRNDSYVARMKKIDPNLEVDLFIVQLSANDASQKYTMGEISDSFKMEDFDDKTVAGAIEYIIAYVKETWDCPVVFYTGTYNGNGIYHNMVKMLWEIQEKWDIGVIDLYGDDEMKELMLKDKNKYNEYMADMLHPTRLGYEEWWTPKFEEYLVDMWSN